MGALRLASRSHRGLHAGAESAGGWGLAAAQGRGLASPLKPHAPSLPPWRAAAMAELADLKQQQPGAYWELIQDPEGGGSRALR